MQVVWIEMCFFCYIICFIWWWEGGDVYWVGWFVDIKQLDQFFVVFLVVEYCFIQYYQQVMIWQWQCGMCFVVEWWVLVVMINQFWLGMVFDIQQCQVVVVLVVVGGIFGNNGVMQCIVFVLWLVWCFIVCLVYFWQLLVFGYFGFMWIGQIDGQEDVVGKIVDQCRYICLVFVDVLDVVNIDVVK